MCKPRYTLICETHTTRTPGIDHTHTLQARGAYIYTHVFAHSGYSRKKPSYSHSRPLHPSVNFGEQWQAFHHHPWLPPSPSPVSSSLSPHPRPHSRTQHPCLHAHSRHAKRSHSLPPPFAITSRTSTRRKPMTAILCFTQPPPHRIPKSAPPPTLTMNPDILTHSQPQHYGRQMNLHDWRALDDPQNKHVSIQSVLTGKV